jgi:DNA-binding helix-hairpin-helix protein with protein kinase domain
VGVLNEPELEVKTVVPWVITVLMGLVAWFSRRDMSRYDEGLKRIEILERNSVTYDHLERVLDRMRNERATMHVENQTQLNRIETKIDENEERSSKTRHDTQNELHALALKFAEMSHHRRSSSS